MNREETASTTAVTTTIELPRLTLKTRYVNSLGSLAAVRLSS